MAPSSLRERSSRGRRRRGKSIVLIRRIRETFRSRLRPVLAYPLGIARRREATPAPPLQAVLIALDAVRASLGDRRRP
jgi:hypothetical protein